MKLYQINVTARFSTGEIAKNIHHTAIQNGHKARFAFGTGGICEQDFFQISDTMALRIDAKCSQITGREGLFLRGKTKRLIQDIRSFDPDIIHLHNIHGHYVDYRMLLEALEELNKPVVITLHDCWMFTGGCYYFYQNGCDKWKCVCKDCEYCSGYLLHDVFPVENAEFDRKKTLFSSINQLYVATVSNWLKVMAEQSFLNGCPIYTVPNGIDTRTFQIRDACTLKERLGCAGKTVLLGVASTWSHRKGLDKWIELAGTVDDTYQIVLVGLNRGQIEKLPKNIIGLPRVKKAEELADLYNIADIYINLSYEETFGLPTVEAMACGTPAIVLNATANPELITEGTGIVIEEATPETVMGAVKRIQAWDKADTSAACVEHVRQHYSIEAMTKGYLQVYDTVIKECGLRGRE